MKQERHIFETLMKNLRSKKCAKHADIHEASIEYRRDQGEAAADRLQRESEELCLRTAAKFAPMFVPKMGAKLAAARKRDVLKFLIRLNNLYFVKCIKR